MTEVLILYIDSDFIYPVVTDGHGACERYEHPDRRFRDFRIWLYFERDMAGGRLLPVKRARAGYYAGNPAFSGDVFSLFGDKKEKAAGAEKLLTDSGVVRELKELYSHSGLRSEVNIPTVYVFAGNISQGARKGFIDFMERNSFATLSFTVPLESLGANTLFQGASFGDMLLAYTGSGNDMIGANYVFDSKEFLLSSPPEVFKDSGFNPVREALVHYVVNKIESKYGFLVDEASKRAEIEHQKQNVDGWLRDIDLSTPVSTIAYKYKNFDSEYQVQVDSDLLKNELNKYVDRQLQQMNIYRNRAAASITQSDGPIKQILLLGDMFADADFRNRVAASVGRGAEVKYVPVEDFSSLLCLYPTLYPELQENLLDFERISRKTDDRTAATAKFISMAGTLSAVAQESATLAREFESLASAIKKKMDIALARVDEMLAVSNFVAADEALAQAEIPTVDSPLFARLAALKQAIARNRDHLSNPNAKAVASRIDSSMELIEKHSAEVNAESQRAAGMSGEIERLRRAWPEYQRLMEEFESAEVSRKRAIVDEIASGKLTREPLPLTGLRSPFLAELRAEVVKSGGFLGFGAKKTLKVSVLFAPGYCTECKTVVLVQSVPLVSILPSNIRKTIDAGVREKVDFEVPLPLDGNSSAKRVYVYLKPAPDQAISPNDEHIGVKHLDIEI